MSKSNSELTVVLTLIAVTFAAIVAGFGKSFCERNPGASYVIGGSMELARCPK
jgi:hypothetical protein